MKFFKHFTDAHRGQSLQRLKDRHGMKGIGIYWTLVELCAEKLIKTDSEEYTAEHCTFSFHHRYIKDTLETHQLKNLLMYLRSMHDVGLMSFECVDDVVVIHMPKLLECMDRDTKRARKQRDMSAPKNKIKNKIEDKDTDITPVAKVPVDPFGQKRFNRHKLPQAAELWNANCGELTKLNMCTSVWASKSDALLAEYGAEEFTRAVVLVASNSFLTGNSKSKWKATFSWLIKDDNLAKVLVGDYSNESSVDDMLLQMGKELAS